MPFIGLVDKEIFLNASNRNSGCVKQPAKYVAYLSLKYLNLN